MSISWNLINKYVDIKKISRDRLIDDLFLMGFEVESFKDTRNIDNFIIGKVIDIKKHPNANKLSVCQVEIAKNKYQTIVCGANNLIKGKMVVVALPKAILPSGLVIIKRNIRGIESNGMICSLSEIGVDVKYQSKDDLKGIHKLNDNAKVSIGDNAFSYLNLEDLIFDITFTSNRNNATGIYYLAKEIAQYYNLKIKELEIDEKIEGNIKNDINITVKTNDCLNFAWVKIKEFNIKESPKWLKDYLYLANIRSVNNVVDLTNMILVELNQSMHAYDLNYCGSDIFVKNSNNLNKVKTLDDTHHVPNKLVCVENNKETLSIGGIIGCVNGSIKDDTKNILLEAAVWNPVYIRKVIRKTKISTQSGISSSKKISDYNMPLAIKRFIYLAKKMGIVNNYSDMIISKPLSKETFIDIKAQDVKNLCGFNIDKKDLENFLSKKFEIKTNKDNIKVTIPPYRIDITCKEDLISEFMKKWGLHNIETQPIKTILSKNNEDDYLNTKNKLTKYLNSLGLCEVKTYSLVNNNDCEELNFYSKSIKVKNPIDIEKSYYRRNIMSSLFSVFLYNNFRKCQNINIFEIGKIYHFENKNKVIENAHLSLLLSSPLFLDIVNKQAIKVNINNVQEIIKNIIINIGFDESKIKFNTKQYKCNFIFSENSSIVEYDGKSIGKIITVNPKVLHEKKANTQDVIICELELNNIVHDHKLVINNNYKLQPIIKDLSFLASRTVDKNKLINYIQNFKEIDKCYLFDYYKKENHENVGIRLFIKQDDENRDKEIINKLFKKIISDCEKIFKIKINQ